MLLGFALPKKQPRAGRDGALSLQPQRDVALGGKHQHPRKSSWEFTGKRFPLELLQKLGTVPVLGKIERQQRTGKLRGSKDLEQGRVQTWELLARTGQVFRWGPCKPCKVRFPGKAAALEKGLCQLLPRMMEMALEFTHLS